MKLYIVSLVYDREIRIKADICRTSAERYVFLRKNGSEIDSVRRDIVLAIKEQDYPQRRTPPVQPPDSSNSAKTKQYPASDKPLPRPKKRTHHPTPRFLSQAYNRGALINMLNTLNGTEFEQLCYMLIDRDGRFEGVNHTGVSGNDRGEDVVASSGPGPRSGKWVFQCKTRTRFEFRHFASELDKLAKNKCKYHTVVFLTNKNISASMQTKVCNYAKQLKFNNVIFWGESRIFEMVESYPEILPKSFASRSVMADVEHRLSLLEVKSKSEDTTELLRALHERVAELDNRSLENIEGIKIGVGVIVFLLMVRAACDLIDKLQRPLLRLEKDKKKWNKIRENTDKRREKYGKRANAFADRRITVSKDEKRRFLREALVNKWGQTSDVYNILKDKTLKKHPDFEAELISDAGNYTSERATQLWLSFRQFIKINVVEFIDKYKPKKYSIRFGRRPLRCDKCRKSMCYEKTNQLVVVSADGEYIGLSATVLVCYSCKKAHVPRIHEEHNLRL